MKKLISFLFLLLTVFVAKADQVKDLRQAKFSEFLKDFEIFTLLPILLSLGIILCLMIIENKLKNKINQEDDSIKVSLRFGLSLVLIFLQIFYLVLIFIVFIIINQGFLFYFKLSLFFLSCSFIFAYGPFFTNSDRKSKRNPFNILNILFVLEVLLFLLNLFDFYLRF